MAALRALLSIHVPLAAHAVQTGLLEACTPSGTEASRDGRCVFVSGKERVPRGAVPPHTTLENIRF